MTTKEAAARLEAWFASHGRDLPWRRTHDPYHVLLAEFVLQQTRMETGIPYFERLVARFPTVESLARARPSTVLSMWSGLGYYARARNLHATARRIVSEFGGRVPSDPQILRGLPGIGPYTAGAIASIAYDRPEPSLDGNQFRVLGRLRGLVEAPGADERRRIETFARDLLAHGSPRRLNQALMDLGSLVCLPENPRCEACPLARTCLGRSQVQNGRKKRSPSEAPLESWSARIYVRDGRVWLLRPQGAGLLGELWLPPLARRRGTGGAAHFEHVFSHKAWRVTPVRSRGTPRGDGRWVAPDELRRLPHSRLTVRLMEWALAPRDGARPGARRARARRG